MADTPWYQRGPDDGRWPAAEEPRSATPIGAASAERFGLYLGSEAMSVIEHQINQAPDKPVAGLLVGFPAESAERPFLLITGAIPLPDPPAGEEPVRFGPRLFDRMEEIWKNLRRSGAVVAGWYHGRPSRGIAMSGYERFTHHRYFPKPWQVALFIDTGRNASLLYRWEEGDLAPCEAFYYWNMQKEPPAPLFADLPARSGAAREVAAALSESAHTEADRRRLSWTWLLVLAMIYTLIPGAPGGLFWLRERVAHESRRLNELEMSLRTAETVGIALETARERGAPTPAAGSGQAPPGGLSPATPSAPSGSPAAPPAGSDYVIQPGDTMWSISARLLGDPWGFARIAEQNGIPDPDLIFPGQTIVLPDGN